MSTEAGLDHPDSLVHEVMLANQALWEKFLIEHEIDLATQGNIFSIIAQHENYIYELPIDWEDDPEKKAIVKWIAQFQTNLTCACNASHEKIQEALNNIPPDYAVIIKNCYLDKQLRRRGACVGGFTGAITGAKIGAMIGLMLPLIGLPLGLVIGAFVGVILGALGGYTAAKVGIQIHKIEQRKANFGVFSLANQFSITNTTNSILSSRPK